MEFTEGVRFDSLHLSPEIIRAIEKRNIEVSTPVSYTHLTLPTIYSV